MVKRILLCAVVAALALPGYCDSKDGGLPIVNTRLRSLVAFKNGLAFAVRAGQTQLMDGWGLVDMVPTATLGTLWIGSTNPVNRVEDVVAFKDSVSKESDALSLSELLAANVGKVVAITYTLGPYASQPVTIEGTILSVPADCVSDDTTGRRNYDVTPRDSYSYNYNYSNRPQNASLLPGMIVLIRESNGSVTAINKSSVQALKMHDGGSVKSRVDSKVDRLKVQLQGKPKSGEITVGYLEKGITWSPSYLVDLKDDTDKDKSVTSGVAEVTLDAVLANDVEDLDDTDVSFAVGFPNFAFADITSPVSLQQTVGQFIQNLSRPNNRNDQNNAWSYGYSTMAQSVAYNSPAGPGGPAGSSSAYYSATQPLPGESNEDLFFYHQAHVTMKKGDRARYVVFTDKVPYQHIYQLEIPDTMNIDDRGYRRSTTQDQQPDPLVWHALKMENNSKHPWTTAPAFVVSGTKPIAQDVLKYAPSGGKSTLKLTVATDIRAEQTHTEASRVEVARLGNTYYQVTVDGKISVRNWKQKPININIKKYLMGEVVTAAQGGRTTKIMNSVTGLNQTSQIEWELPLKAGEEKVLAYQYKVLVSR